MTAPDIYIGLMSGTSVDSVDAAAVSFGQDNLRLLGTHSHDIPANLKKAILGLSEPGIDDVLLYSQTDNEIGELFAQATLALMSKLNITASQVKAIGSHGQTVRHQPPGIKNGFSQQIGNPNLIAAQTGCSVVADFRRADMALGGQGAPLVPAFHKSLFSHSEQVRIILNIGGISNITILYPDGKCQGFDTGPGNILLDGWCSKNRGEPYDNGGEWASSGTPSRPLLNQLMQHRFLDLTPPKSTGREDFNLAWLEQQVRSYPLSPEDIQSTLTLFTVETIAQGMASISAPIDGIFACGGGVHNAKLISELNLSLSTRNLPEINLTSEIGLHPDWVEACAFAWLAKQRVEKKVGNLPSVTGASKAVVLGGLYLP